MRHLKSTAMAMLAIILTCMLNAQAYAQAPSTNTSERLQQVCHKVKEQIRSIFVLTEQLKQQLPQVKGKEQLYRNWTLSARALNLSSSIEVDILRGFYPGVDASADPSPDMMEKVLDATLHDMAARVYKLADVSQDALYETALTCLEDETELVDKELCKSRQYADEVSKALNP